ncbi:hypothetical protein D3C74_349550 [compost metagenome]
MNIKTGDKCSRVIPHEHIPYTSPARHNQSHLLLLGKLSNDEQVIGHHRQRLIVETFSHLERGASTIESNDIARSNVSKGPFSNLRFLRLMLLGNSPAVQDAILVILSQHSTTMNTYE